MEEIFSEKIWEVGSLETHKLELSRWRKRTTSYNINEKTVYYNCGNNIKYNCKSLLRITITYQPDLIISVATKEFHSELCITTMFS